jgi:hypothetical protein
MNNINNSNIIINADVFIIPNSATYIENFLLEYIQDSCREICELNDIEPTDLEKMVQVWCCRDNPCV